MGYCPECKREIECHGWFCLECNCKKIAAERDEALRRLANERADAKERETLAWDTCELYADDRNEVQALLDEGLALWETEPRPGLRSAWFDFWGKVRGLREEEGR